MESRTEQEIPSEYVAGTPVVMQSKEIITIINGGGEFRFAKVGCVTPEAILHAVMYLCRFPWATSRMVYEFVEIAVAHAGIDVEPKPKPE